MRPLNKILAALSSATLISGCSIHPLPEDFAPLDTVAIAEHIRCEMHDALRAQIIDIFSRSAHPQAKYVATVLSSDPRRSPKDFEAHVKFLDEDYQPRIPAFEQTSIGYGFRFNITEQNVANASLGFTFPYTLVNTFKLTTGGGIDKTRVNTRRFFETDTFGDLVTSTDCLEIARRDSNLAYPITGKIGLKKVVSDFVRLSTRGAKTKHHSDVRNFSEKLTFTTKINGSLNPSVELGTVANAFRLTKASIDLSATRTDVHEVTITFALSDEFDEQKLRRLPKGRNKAVQELQNLRILEAIETGGTVGPIAP